MDRYQRKLFNTLEGFNKSIDNFFITVDTINEKKRKIKKRYQNWSHGMKR